MGKGEGKGKDYPLLNQRLEVFLVSNVILFWGGMVVLTFVSNLSNVQMKLQM